MDYWIVDMDLQYGTWYFAVSITVLVMTVLVAEAISVHNSTEHIPF